MFLHALVLNISAIITAASYPLVVRLYRLFEYICTFKLLHEDFIHSVWNNIYIFVAVIVLFAIAIKLISAMVNPDLLTDSKKGAKSYYFRAVAAVILIFLVPIVFEKSFEIQEELLTKNMLSSHVFGYKVEEGTNLGQILAWEGFSAFCLPDKASQDKIDSRYLSIRADMDNINSVMNEIRLQKSAKYALPTLIVLNDNQWEYHSILCPLVGLLLVYEMVLLCMDTLFRAAKLAFLQIMTPIVLGAFVFDPSILKKWAKEFFSTYISLFLKVLAMYFIAITISQIQAEIAKTDFYNGDWLLTGLFKILLIIALLQLAKKIPDLINKIFGLEIKLRGGIKGRLGEMAGIGGIAQKAWTSLGAGFRNLGKTALAAPAAIGFGAADTMYKKKHDGKSLMDTKAFRQAKGIFAGAKQAWKTGSPIGAYKAYDEGTKAPAYTTSQRLAARDAVINRMRANAKDPSGRSLIDSSGNFVNQYFDSNGNLHYIPISEVEKTQAGLIENLEKRGDAGKFKAQELKANEFKSQLEMLDSKNKAAIKALNDYQALNSNIDPNGVLIAGQIAESINKGIKLTGQQRNWLTKLSTNDSNIKVADEQINKMYSQAADMTAKYNGYNGDTSQLAIGQLIGVQDGVAKDANNRYTQASQLSSDVDKDAIETIATTYTSTFKAHGGAYQNNGQVISIMEHFGNGGDVKYNGTQYVDASGHALNDKEQSIFELIKNGRVKTSIGDYYGEDFNESYIEEFDKFVSDAKSDAKASMAAMGIIPGDSNYETMYANEYYRSLHDNINKTYGTNGTKSADPKAAEIRSRLHRITSSHILP